MEKEKIHLEYMLKGGSGTVIWNLISTPSGLETWFADHVTADNKVFTFCWGKTEQRQAEAVNFRANNFIRFRWLDEENGGVKTYFELRMIYNEMMGEYVLEVTDFAESDETEDLKEIWDSSIEALRRVSGL
jgi:uncharacterized protein YndB with AHSA1/START domain